MRCTCGHVNPDENRYCGMCGAPLLIKPAEHTYVASEEPLRGPMQRAEREPQAIPPAIAEATRFSEYPARNNWNGRQAEIDDQDEQPLPRNGSETTVSGPSFLGLSGNEGGTSSSGYSYLFQDEPEKSHTGLYILLALLVIGGAVLYWKWQPIRDYVVSTAIAHSQKPKPAQEQAAAASGEEAGHTPAPPVDVAPTPLRPEPKAGPTADTNAAEKKADAASAGTTPSDKASTGKKAAATEEPAAAAETTPSQPAKKTGKAARGASSEAAPAVSRSDDTDATSSRKNARAAGSKPEPARPQAVPGSELVQAGERFLYGRGVPRNCNQAVTYFRAAAGQKNPQAYSQLGALYATGECVPMDRAQAYSWFSRALAAQRNSNPYIERNLTMLWRDMTPQERQRVAGKSY